MHLSLRHLQRLVFSPSPHVRRLTLGLLLVTGAAAIALLIGIVGPTVALALALAIIGGTLVLLDTHWGFVALVGVIFGLPFASLPFSIGFKPTFLDAALGALFFVWLFKLISGRERRFLVGHLGLLVGLFMLLALFSFVFGFTHTRPTSFTLRRFAEILIGISLYFVTINTVRSQKELVWVIRWLLWAGWIGGLLAVGFYLIPEMWTVSILDRLARFDYPGGYGALRWIEDDPNGTMRAIGTAVDPNVLGGMMILVAAALVPHLVARRPLFPRWMAAGMAATAATALYLTYSRSALLGLVAAVAWVAFLRYRRLIPLGLLGALLFILLPQTQEYVARLMAGLALEDLATQMRLGEYKDALILIGRYPLFGVGFNGVPDIDLYLGVSMLYLVIAEHTGLVGLAAFTVTVIAFFALVLRSWRVGFSPEREPILLGLSGAVWGAMVSGVFDHYWFNMTYPHMTVLFWLCVGLTVATVLIEQQTHDATADLW